MSDSEVGAAVARALRASGVELVCGVPDSLLQEVIVGLETEFGSDSFLVCANEGSAIGVAIGHFLATGKVPVVFLQNSGLGNAVNPLVSLADSLVYSVPMVLLVGWRGEILPTGCQVQDEPQHLRQGRATLKQLEILDIPIQVLEQDEALVAGACHAVGEASRRRAPVAIVVRAASSRSNKSIRATASELPSREEYVRVVSDICGPNMPIVATTGMIGRELCDARSGSSSEEHRAELPVVGGMGHAISLATGVARETAPNRVICLDGDGSVLMHTGAMLLAAQQPNLLHIVLDNGVHDSVGGQATGSLRMNWESLSEAFGYGGFFQVSGLEDFSLCLQRALKKDRSVLLRARCRPGHRADLGRPKQTPREMGLEFGQLIASIAGRRSEA